MKLKRIVGDSGDSWIAPHTSVGPIIVKFLLRGGMVRVSSPSVYQAKLAGLSPQDLYSVAVGDDRWLVDLILYDGRCEWIRLKRVGTSFDWTDSKLSDFVKVRKAFEIVARAWRCAIEEEIKREKVTV